jgi:xanthine dehydrogenase small subunit
VLEAVEVPLPVANQRFRTYKISKRYDSDISAVCAAFALRLDGPVIAGCRIAFGGMAPVPKRAAQAEAALVGQAWTEAAARAAGEALARDFAPLTDLRASAGYRLRVAQNLLLRFHLETRPVDPLAAAQLSVFAAA